MAHVVGFTDEAREVLNRLDVVRREEARGRIAELAEDPYRHPSTQVHPGGSRDERLCPLADRVMTYYHVNSAGSIMMSILFLDAWDSAGPPEEMQPVRPMQ